MEDKQLILDALRSGSMHLEGQFRYGSNYTFLVNCSHREVTFKAVYKPIQGERPLWDFPPQTLARREVATYLVCEALAWNLVPPTLFRIKGLPAGPGSVQYFIEHDPDYHYFTFSDNHRVYLPQVMLFDLLINNADRKAGHLLADPQGKLWLIDHGLTFHQQDKLRTVIWDHAGQSIPTSLVSDVENILPELEPGKPLYQSLLPHLSVEEIRALKSRASTLTQTGVFPLPPEDRRAYPWPLV
jgi:hypothetical protein